MAISIEELRDTISSRLPGETAIPSTETLRLQFHPIANSKTLHISTPDDLM